VKGPDRRGLRLPIFENVTVPMLMSKVILKDLMFVTVTSVACVLLFMVKFYLVNAFTFNIFS